MNIGFFGDSFCCEKSGPMSWLRYKTYISKLEDHYKANIVSLGHGGSSVWDLLLNQFTPLIEKKGYPDVCIFTWTIPGRLFHRTKRNLTPSSNWTPAQVYYSNFYDPIKDEIEYLSFLRYFDDVVLSEVPEQTKIIHLWSFGKPDKFDNASFKTDKLNYHYRWKHGLEIRPSLTTVTLIDRSIADLTNDLISNHIDGNFKNNLVFEIIKTAIDNYQSGKLINESDTVNKYWKK